MTGDLEDVVPRADDDVSLVWAVAGPHLTAVRLLDPPADELLLNLSDPADGVRVLGIACAQVEVMCALGDEQRYNGVGHAAQDATRRPRIEQSVAAIVVSFKRSVIQSTLNKIKSLFFID